MTVRVVIAGASGYTGQLITQRLLNEKCKLLLVGRDLDKCRKIFGDNIELALWSDLPELLSEDDIVVNCAGPFRDLDWNLLKSIFAKPLRYFDITGEADFVKSIWELQQTQGIRAQVVPSMSFESALVDLLALKLLESCQTKPEKLYSFYHLENVSPSAGTLASMAGARKVSFGAFTDGCFTALEPTSESRSVKVQEIPEVDTAFFSPYPEVISFALAHGAGETRSYQLTSRTQFEALLAFRSLFSSTSSRRERRVTSRPPGGSYQVILSALDENNVAKCPALRVWGDDSYRLTVELMVQAVLETLKSPSPRLEGLHFPSQIFKFSFLENCLSRCGAAWAPTSIGLSPSEQKLPSNLT
jgi:hypothetical protein